MWSGPAVVQGCHGHAEAATGLRLTTTRNGVRVRAAAAYREGVVDLERAASCRCRTGSSPPRSAATRTPRIPTWCAGTAAEPLVHGATYFDRLVDRGRGAAGGRPPVLHRLARRPRRAAARRRPDRRRAVRRGRQARRGGQGPDVALAPGQARSSARRRTATSATTIEAAGGEVLLDQRVRRGGSHHQKLVVLRHPGRAGARRRVRRRHRPVPQPPRRRRPPRRPAGGADVAERTASARPGTTSSWSCAARWWARSTLTFRERWNDPTPLDQHSPIAYLRDKLRARRPDAPTALPPQPPDPPPCGPHAVQVLRTYPAMRPRVRLRPARRADRRPRLHQGDHAGPAG